jgi:hypothetical protein
LVTFAAAIKQRVVKDFICLDFMILHLVKSNQGLLDVFFFAITFDHGTVRYQIWLDLVAVRA